MVLYKTDREDKLSPAAAGLLLLVWQEPSDRALKGWSPFPGMRPDTLSEEGLARWLQEQMRATIAEEDDMARLHQVD